MDNRIKEQAKRVSGIFLQWLHDAKSGMGTAREKTISDHLFPAHDVDFSLQCFERQVTEDKLSAWINEQVADFSTVIPQKILCLHAGNLPMVGLQDVLACLLLGHAYRGKISRKDPYLIPSFLEYWNRIYPEESTVWSTNLDHYHQLNAGAVMFSGSAETVPQVRNILDQGNMVSDDAKYLVRTAHFSIAYLDRDDPAHIKALTEAIARYEGKGCRSVAVVVSPISLRSVQCHLIDFFESYWTNNPPVSKQRERLKYRIAYNKAISRSHVPMDIFLIEENDPDLDENVIYWLKGGPDKVQELADHFADQVQNIYVTGNNVTIAGWQHRTDWLSRAQCPPISWKPDGVDVLKWLSELTF